MTNKENKARLDEIDNPLTKLEDAIRILKQYETILMTQKKKIIGLLYRQDFLLKNSPKMFG